MSEITAKTIITKSKLPEVDYCFNPYIGCTHRCAYCYARFMSRFTGHTNEKWGTYLDWKINAPELLREEASRIKKKGGVVILGSVTDCYQPIESKLELTRKCLEVFLEYQIPISILTKSSLVERDFDLLSQLKYCEIGISLSILNKEQQKALEPGASSPMERIRVLKRAFDLGLNTYAFIGPIHPFLGETEKVIREVCPYVNFIMGEIPNLRCGNWKDFSQTLKELKINPVDYRKVAESDEFYKKADGLLKKLCEECSVEYRGTFKH
ncbi:MAG: radical SAM protein [Candidatus Moranbacteria bacterium]|nr:radical SAM protein [Candidatus Moranbacteria bacterium]